MNPQAEGHDYDAVVRARLRTTWFAIDLHKRITGHDWVRSNGERCAVCGLSLHRLVNLAAELER